MEVDEISLLLGNRHQKLTLRRKTGGGGGSAGGTEVGHAGLGSSPSLGAQNMGERKGRQELRSYSLVGGCISGSEVSVWV